MMRNALEYAQEAIKDAEENGYRWIDLSNNELTEIPESIAKLTNLTTLDLRGNKLTKIPESITKLTNLTTLNLRNNQLTEIPESITKLTNLTKLYLRYNQLTEIPESIAKLTNLTTLNLRNNQLIEIPESITKLTNLTTLGLSGNPIKTPPLEIANKGIDAIKDYFRQIKEEGKEYLYEAKLLIVGEGGAGKTTLVKKIMNPDYELKENEGTTWGIDVIQWNFPIANENKFRVNIWDFGGQQIYHATHQFFLTKRSLYVLVADTRKEDTDFFYWLNVVELLSDNSPILIIKNEKQDRYREINERQLRGRFTNLKEVLATNRDLDKVINEIKHQIQSLPHIGSPLPKTWTKVREELEKDKRNYISQDEYLNICQENGFTQMKDKLQLSGYLHDLGVCLHFQDDSVLRKTVILKSEWATDAVYKVLDNGNVIRNFGRFSKDDLANIWNEQRYDGMYDELLQLMIKFKLCYEIPGSSGKYIAPHLLTMNQPNYEWDENENIIIRYTYDFMPKGMISLFIVAMHEYITCDGNGNDCLWKSGVVLERDNTKAEVIEFYEKNEIRIRVEGKNKKELLAIIMFEWEKIHKSYNRLKYETLVPCNCEKCKNSQSPFFYEYSTLQDYRNTGDYEIQCQKSRKMVNVLGLIDDVMERRKDMPEAPLKLFYSYSHGDEEMRDDLETHLKLMQRQGVIEAWHDRDILAGDEWKEKIDENLEHADIILLLVTANFLASDYCYDVEMKRAMERHEAGDAVVIPVIIKDVDWHDSPFGKLQPLPKDGKAVETWEIKNTAWKDVTEAIKRVAKSI
jgi:internalin A